MAPKKNISGKRPTPPDATPHDNSGQAPHTRLEPPLPLDIQTRQTSSQRVAEPAATKPALVVMTHSTAPLVNIDTARQRLLEHYRVKASDRLPQANAEGFRVYRERDYVDVENGDVVMVAVDPETGLYRARLESERVASGPLLLRDSDRHLWQPIHDGDTVTLLDTHLQTFRTDLELTGIVANGEGIFRHDNRLYLRLHSHAYQVMHDVSASTATQKAWRIINQKDPVASDNANIYRASRSGETRSVRREDGDAWVYHLPPRKADLQDAEIALLSIENLMQMYAPIKKKHTALDKSNELHNTLWDEITALPGDSTERNVKLLTLEVSLLKHNHLQADFIESVVLNKRWLILLKISGAYKRELRTFRMDYVETINRLMAVMDWRVRPALSMLDVDSCKRAIAHLNKKLRYIEEREVMMAEIRKADPGTAPTLEELRQQVPSAERINFNKLTLNVHLLAGTPEHAPSTIMPSLVSIDLFTGDLANLPRNKHPMVLMLTLDQIRNDKNRFEIRLADNGPDAEYIKQIIALTEPFEQRVERRLTDILDAFDRRTELPSLDQDIDFDFIPPQPLDGEASRPAPPRKVFRTRQHGTSRVLVGDTETAPDGSVTVKVCNPFQPDGPAQRYEKRQGEWQPVRPPLTRSPRPELVRTAKRLLANVDQDIAEAGTRVGKKEMTANIVDDLESAAKLLHEQARRLEHYENAANDSEVTALAGQLKTAGRRLETEAQQILLRKFKSKDVLDVMRLNYLMDHAEVTVHKTVDRKPMGKGEKKSFLDVFSIRDSANKRPLWEAHFHYDRHDSLPLNFARIDGGHLKTLEQSKRGIESQRRDAQAGLPHVEIWRQTFDGNTASKLFALASSAAERPQ
jgi:hypothetical protein